MSTLRFEIDNGSQTESTPHDQESSLVAKLHDDWAAPNAKIHPLSGIVYP
jgi:hypothetical protein